MKENTVDKETVQWEKRKRDRESEWREKEGVFRGRLLLRFTNLFLQQILWDPLTEVNRL